jgi:hypothetical protein
LASGLHADVRIQSNRWLHICRLIINSESQHGARTLHDGPARKGYRKRVRGPVTVCIRRSSVPEVCSGRLTRWSCKTNAKANRTILFNIH